MIPGAGASAKFGATRKVFHKLFTLSEKRVVIGLSHPYAPHPARMFIH